MPNYRRWFVPGGTYFFTAVTHNRRPIFATDQIRALLRKSLAAEQRRAPFDLTAFVVLPDHLHTIWTLPDGDSDYPMRWKRIKERFTRDYVWATRDEQRIRSDRWRGARPEVWQPRYWEHLVRDEDDFKRCVDYLHWNPVKHGLVKRVADYPWSSFRQFVDLGEYDIGWGSAEVTDVPGAEWD